MELISLKRDSKVVSEGMWVKDIPMLGDVEIKARGWSSRVVMEARAELERKVPASDRHPDMRVKAEVGFTIWRTMISEAVLVDIKNLTENGKEITLEEVRKMVLDPDYEPLADAIAWAGNFVDRVRSEKKEIAAKN